MKYLLEEPETPEHTRMMIVTDYMKNHFKTVITILTISLLGITVQADTASGSSTKMDSNSNKAKKEPKTWDKAQMEKFMKKAAEGGLMEVQLGDTAQKHATSAQVRDFGSLMVTDHSKANQELKAVAQEMGVEIPATPAKNYMDKIEKLSKTKGDMFDKKYMKLMVKDYTSDVSDFEKAEKNIPAGALKTWVSNT